MRVEVDAHLQRCAACRRVLERAGRLSAFLTGTPAPPVPEQFAERLVALAKQRQEQAGVARAIQAWWPRLSMPTRATAAAALALALISGLAAGWRSAQLFPDKNFASPSPKANPLAGYSLDYLADVPEGSLAASYLALVGSRNGEGSQKR